MHSPISKKHNLETRARWRRMKRKAGRRAATMKMTPKWRRRRRPSLGGRSRYTILSWTSSYGMYVMYVQGNRAFRALNPPCKTLICDLRFFLAGGKLCQVSLASCLCQCQSLGAFCLPRQGRGGGGAVRAEQKSQIQVGQKLLAADPNNPGNST